MTLRVHDCDVQRILIDGGCSTNVFFLETFKKLWLDESQIQRSSSPLIGFKGNKVIPIGIVTLTVEGAVRTLQVEFIVIYTKTAYNAIIGRGWIHEMEGLASTLNQVIRCLSPNGTKAIDI